MSGRFHINGNGDVMPCRATKNACQFGGDDLHFTNSAEARSYAEKLLKTLASEDPKAEPRSEFAPEEDKLRNEGFEKTDKFRIKGDEAQMILRSLLSSGLGEDSLKSIFRTWRGDLAFIYKNKAGVGFVERVRAEDVPLTAKNAQAWNMSLHPAGPQINYNCPKCGATGRKRFGELNRASTKTKYPVLRCTCGQLVKIPFEYS